MVHFLSGKAIVFISDMLLQTNSSPPCKPVFSHSPSLPLHAHKAVPVCRWHLREAPRSAFRASLAHTTGQTFLHSNRPATPFCITREAKPLYLDKTPLPALCPPRFKFIMCTLFLLRLLPQHSTLSITVYKNDVCWHRTERALCIISSSICLCPLFQATKAYFTARWFLERFSTDNLSKKRCC